MNHDAIGSGRRHQLVLIAIVVAISVLSGAAYAQQTPQATLAHRYAHRCRWGGRCETPGGNNHPSHRDRRSRRAGEDT